MDFFTAKNVNFRIRSFLVSLKIKNKNSGFCPAPLTHLKINPLFGQPRFFAKLDGLVFPFHTTGDSVRVESSCISQSLPALSLPPTPLRSLHVGDRPRTHLFGHSLLLFPPPQLRPGPAACGKTCPRALRGRVGTRTPLPSSACLPPAQWPRRCALWTLCACRGRCHMAYAPEPRLRHALWRLRRCARPPRGRHWTHLGGGGRGRQRCRRRRGEECHCVCR